MKADLNEEQAALLARVARGPLVLSGYETDEQRLAMLQLYAAGLVHLSTSQARPSVMTWRITTRGQAALQGS